MRGPFSHSQLEILFWNILFFLREDLVTSFVIAIRHTLSPSDFKNDVGGRGLLVKNIKFTSNNFFLDGCGAFELSRREQFLDTRQVKFCKLAPTRRSQGILLSLIVVVIVTCENHRLLLANTMRRLRLFICMTNHHICRILLLLHD